MYSKEKHLEKALRNLQAQKEFKNRIENVKAFIEIAQFPDLIPEAKKDIQRWRKALARLREEYNLIILSLSHHVY